MSARIELHLAADREAPAQARHALERARGWLKDPVVDDLCLLVSELVTNSVRHARADPHEGIHLRAEISEGRIRVEVADRGPGFDPTQRDRRPDRASGWGLELVDRIADRWGVTLRTDGGTTVWFEIGGDRDQRAAPAGGGRASAPRGRARLRSRLSPLRPGYQRHGRSGPVNSRRGGHRRWEQRTSG